MCHFVLSLLSSTVKFDDCMGNEEVVFESSEPGFGVRTDGSIFAQGEPTALEEPVQFKLTASGPHTHVWKTVIQLALIDPPSLQPNENEVSYTVTERKHRHSNNMPQISIIIPEVVFFSASHHIFSSGLVIVTAKKSGQTPMGS